MPTAKRAAGSEAPRAGAVTSTSPRRTSCALLATLITLLAPQAASASATQLSLLQDDRELAGDAGRNPAVVMREIRDLGVDVLRTNVIFNKVYKRPLETRKPAGFVTSNPNSSSYDWSRFDRLVDLARANGIQVLMTVTGPGPYWSSEDPRRCRRPLICTYKPQPREFGAFVAAAAQRFAGRVQFYSIYNEPNLGKTWLTPRFERTSAGTVDVAGAIYRKLWIAGYKAIARHDPARRNRVLFGEVSAIAAPLPMLNAALCLDPRGKRFKTAALRAAHGCAGRVAKLNVGGFAVHPYNQGGNGTPLQRTKTKTSLPTAYLPRLHRLMDGAVRAGRIPGGRGIYITEFGYQSNPPDQISNVSLAEQAQYINESDRLHYADPRVKSVAQYELSDVPQQDQFNSGLRFVNGGLKPAYAAYRLPVVVTRSASDSVEVYGQLRPARLLGPGVAAQILIQADTGAGFQTVRTVSGNSRGIFRTDVSVAGAAGARWRLVSQGLLTSRVATAGAPLRYYRD